MTQKALEQAEAALTLVAERMKWYYDQKVQSVLFKSWQQGATQSEGLPDYGVSIMTPVQRTI